MTIKTRWPKKMPVREYRQLHYTDGGRCQGALVNDIKRGDLPGVKDGRKWYIYVLPDGSPAHGYSENAPTSMHETKHQESVTLTGNALADSILAKVAANNGLRVS
ncbi:MAG: hypothetical protein ACPGF7_14520 [Pontibacterium sp.]